MECIPHITKRNQLIKLFNGPLVREKKEEPPLAYIPASAELRPESEDEIVLN